MKRTGILLLVVLFSLCIYQPAYAATSDFDAGYEYGYKDGFDAGFGAATDDETVDFYYNSGYQDGYKQGSGANQSGNYATGHARGFDEGKKAGYDLGYAQGHSDGEIASASTFGSLHRDRLDAAYSEGFQDATTDAQAAVQAEKDYSTQLYYEYMSLIDDYNVLVVIIVALGAIILLMILRNLAIAHRWRDRYKAYADSKRQSRNPHYAETTARLDASPIGITWLLFCMKWRYPAGAVLALASAVYSLLIFDFSRFAGNEAAFVIALCADVLYATTLMALALTFKKITLLGYQTNKFFIGLEAVVLSLSGALGNYANMPLFLGFATRFIGCALFAAINLVYFGKRRFLFDIGFPFPEIDEHGVFQTPDVTHNEIRHSILVLFVVGVVVACALWLLVPWAAPIANVTPV